MTSNNNTTTMKHYYEAIQWNMIAVNELEKNQLDNALTNFRKALVLSKQCSEESRLQQQQQQQQQYHKAHDGGRGEKRSSIDDLVSSSISLQDDDDGTSYIHRRAIVVPMETEEDDDHAIDSIDHHSCSKLSTVILFNIALTNHLLAEEEGVAMMRTMTKQAMMTTMMKQQQQQVALGGSFHHYHRHLLQLQQTHDERRACYLTRSIQLYEMVNRVLSDRTNQLDSPLLMLVTINNIGVACQSLGDKNRANQAFEYLLSTMFLLSERCEKSSYSGQQGRSSGIFFNLTERFIRNVSYLMTTTCTAAAA